MIQYDLSIAENRCIQEETTSLVRTFLHEKLEPSHLSYNKDIAGEPGLLSALSNLFNAYFQPSEEVRPCHVALAAGASICLTTLIRTLCNTGDGVLIPTPYWNGFDFHIAKQAQVHPVPVSFGKFTDSFDSAAIIRALEEAMDSTSSPVKAVVVTNPHNPLGRCYSEDNLFSFARFCGRRGLHFISDEVYALSNFGSKAAPGASPFVSVLSLDSVQAECKRSKVHVIWSMSKDFGCSGIRLSALVSQKNPELLKTLSFAGCLQISNLATLSALGILTAPQLPQLISTNKDRLAESYQIMTTFLEQRALEYVPATAGLYVFTKLLPASEVGVSEARLAEILKATGIAVGTGQAYHAGDAARGWFRLVFSMRPQHLRDALIQLGVALDLATTAEDQNMSGNRQLKLKTRRDVGCPRKEQQTSRVTKKNKSRIRQGES
ncbi:putative aminotransferase aclI [Exophiala dermatitidis]|uniref:1-aminocyclopropane-1-carboxylate synthase n=1 Tax=Exophiala dermatitidis (strain ATCC 34100 / CBS 525.76 / NIH/UT8656) TaxID=858893 RepID=H6BRZ7_EXODN|nr:1-aminocyclopropane-1-carboxylate synthase [Exophiala dermatitidis NIH/UT8656]EHY54825.1 1-aminocyclopropane-1-carboxylate synthase [Exophiala dermatitidis NIH/UT8656]